MTVQHMATRVTRAMASVLIVMAVFAACLAQPVTFGIAVIAIVIAVALLAEARYEERQEATRR